MKNLGSDNDDFSLTNNKLETTEEGTPKKVNKKKRKRQSDGKNEGKKAKSESTQVKSPNGTTIHDFFKSSAKPAKKMRTLDELFVVAAKKSETPKISASNATKNETTPLKMKQSVLVDLTTPESDQKSLSKNEKRHKSSDEKSKKRDKEMPNKTINLCTPEQPPKPASIFLKASKESKSSDKELSKDLVKDAEDLLDSKLSLSPRSGSKEKKVTKSRKKSACSSTTESANSIPIPNSKSVTKSAKTAKNLSAKRTKNASSAHNTSSPSKGDRKRTKSTSTIQGSNLTGRKKTKTEQKSGKSIEEKAEHSKENKRIKDKNTSKSKTPISDGSKKLGKEVKARSENLAKTPKKAPKRRKSSLDGVIFVAEVKKADNPISSPAKPNFSRAKIQKTTSLEITSSPCENMLWTEKYEPKSSSEIVGNSASVERLVLWLKEWKKRWEKEQQEILKQETAKNKNSDDSDSDFELDNDDKKALKEDDTFAKAAVLIGPTGCGKTSVVYACAKELQFKVFEMNGSSLRSSKQILSRLHEATQSHQVSKANKAFNFFIVKENSKKLEGNSLILFEDVDILFEEDKFFWSAIETLITDTKRPIILTTSDGSILVNLQQKYEQFPIGPPSIDKQISCLKNIAQKENCDVTEGAICDVRMTNRLLNCDIRKTIHALHFWGGGNVVIKEENSERPNKKNTKRKSKQRRRSSRRRSKADDVISDESEKEKVLTSKTQPFEDFFYKTCGIFDINCGSKDKTATEADVSIITEKSGIRRLCSLLKNSGGDSTIAESVISTILSANFPEIIKINWMELLPCFESSVSYSVGKTPLSIQGPRATSAPDSDMEFTYDYSSDELPTPAIQEPASDFLIDEDSVDVCYDSKNNLFPCMPLNGPKNPTEKIRTSAANSAKNKMDLHTLNAISSMADVCCLSDRLDYTFSRVQRSERVLKHSLDVSRCKIKDGLCDFLPKETELSHQEITTAWDIQAALQIRSLSHCCAELADVSLENKTTAEELPLRLPHEGKTRRNNFYLRHSLRMKFVGGSFTTPRTFTSDYLPTIRSISRSENAREKSKKKRRFLHYFDSIRVFPRPSEMSRLMNDYAEVVEMT